MSIDPKFMDEQLGIDRSQVAQRYQKLNAEGVNAERPAETQPEAQPRPRRQIAYNMKQGDGPAQEPNFNREEAQSQVQQNFQPYSEQSRFEDDRPQRVVPGMDGPSDPGGPLQSEILAWKKQFGRVYKTTFEDSVYIWRSLNRFEYKQIMSMPNTNELSREEMIAETCVLFPYDYCYEDMVNGPGGVPSLIAEQIMQKSGFSRKVTVEVL